MIVEILVNKLKIKFLENDKLPNIEDKKSIKKISI